MWESVASNRPVVSVAGTTALWVAVFFVHVPRCWSAEDGYIDGRLAVRMLNAVPYQDVQVVLEDIRGEEIVVHGRVDATRRTGFRQVVFDPIYKHRPGSTKPLMVEYYERKLGRPLTDSPEDRQLLSKQQRLVRGFEVDGHLVKDSRGRYRVKSIHRLDMSGPEFPVAMTVRVVILPADDPWTGQNTGDPSGWAIDYRIKGEPEPFRFRIPHRDNPKVSPITTVTVEDPAWSYRSGKHTRVIRFLVRQGPNRPFEGGFELDERGYPIRSWYTNITPIWNQEYAKRYTPWYRWSLQLKSREFESYAEAQQAQPSLFNKQAEVAGILRDLLATSKDPHVQYVALRTLRQLRTIPEDTLPLVKQCLDSGDENVAETARNVLAVHEEFERAQSRRRSY